MNDIRSRIIDAWEKHQNPRLHSGMIDGEPVLVTEFPKPPKFLILCPRNWYKIRKSSSDYSHFSCEIPKFMGMSICVLEGINEMIPDTIEVR